MTTVALAVAVHTAGFESKTWIGGDIAYHRGVALTMQGAALQGEGPFSGLMSYTGGLYPLLVGRTALLGGWTVNEVISVVSWPAVLLLPFGFVYLGHRLWPGRWLTIGSVVAVGTLAAGFSTARLTLWVDAIVPSGHNFWPLYPRDIGLVIMLLAVGSTWITNRRLRVVTVGLLLGLVTVVHFQLAILTALLVAAALLTVRRLREAAVDLSGVALLAVTLSVWWWAPRLAAVVESGGVLLDPHPARTAFEPTIGDLMVGLGPIAVLGIAGLVGGARERTLHWRMATFQLAALVVVAGFIRFVGELTVVSERRLWLVASIPLLILTGTLVEQMRARFDERRVIWGVAVGTSIIVAASALPAIATTNIIDNAWAPGADWGQQFDTEQWDAVVSRIGPDDIVLTYDGYGLATWSYSGARVHSLSLPGYVKLGFDPEGLTGRSYLERNRDLIDAFTAGRAGVCRLAERAEATSLVLDVNNGRIAWTDLWVAAPHRVAPRERATANVVRPVGEDGANYQDRSTYDTIVLQPETQISTPLFASGGAITVAFLLPGDRAESTTLTVFVGAGAIGQVLLADPGFGRIWLEVPEGVAGPVTVATDRAVALQRVTVYESVAALATDINGATALSVGDVCAGSV